MKLLPIIIAASLTACATPDHCWTERETIKTCVELRKTDPRIHCECTSATSEPRQMTAAPVAELPGGSDGGGVKVDPPPEDDHSEGRGWGPHGDPKGTPREGAE